MSNYNPPYNRRPAVPNQNIPPSNGCRCHEETQGSMDFADFPLGMAYVPWQPWDNLYDNKTGFIKGTIFKDLDYDFLGRRCN